MNPSRLFKCLAEDTRLKSILLIHETGEACVCNLIDALQLDQPKISRHLAELRKCDILQDTRRGKWVFYALHPELPEWFRQVIRETAEHNQEYMADALRKLRACKIIPESCC